MISWTRSSLTWRRFAEGEDGYERGGSSDCGARAAHRARRPPCAGPRVGRHRRPQASRGDVRRRGPRVLPDRGPRGKRDPLAAGRGRQRRGLAAGLQPALHRARDHDGLPGRHPDRVRVRQLPGAAHDRRPRPGVSPAERVWILGLPVRGALLYFSFLGGDGLYGAGSAPDVGWFAYAPLTARAFSPGNSTDYWNLSLLVMGFGTVATSINLITTTLTMRCRGMSLGRMPLYVWMMLVVSAMTVLALPPLSAAQIMLLLDRFLGAHFFDTQAGGSAVLWQHFFWLFGHPEVYILIIPGFASASEIIPVFSRKPIFGYPAMVAATLLIGFISVGVWAHHMFSVGMTAMSNTFFVASTLLVGVPTGIKIFNWLGTLYGGQISFEPPMVFCLGFLFQFLIAGLTGVMLGAAPFNWQLTDSYFVVEHFHYMLFVGLGIMVFA